MNVARVTDMYSTPCAFMALNKNFGEAKRLGELALYSTAGGAQGAKSAAGPASAGMDGSAITA